MIYYLWVINAISNIWYSIIGPILPLELEKAMIQETWNGILFGIYAFSAILNSLIIPDICEKYDKISVMTLGLITMGISITGFGLVFYLSQFQYHWIIICASIVLRMIQGFSGSILRVITFSQVVTVYSEEKVCFT